MDLLERSVVVVVDSDEERAALHALRRRSGPAGALDPICVLHPHRPAHLPARGLGGVVVVADWRCTRRDAIAALCLEAARRQVPVVLVRWAQTDDVAPWTLHPAQVVADVAAEQVDAVRGALVRAFVDKAPTGLPLPPGGFARVALVFGDDRRSAFARALAARGLEANAVGLVDEDEPEQPGPVLVFEPHHEAPQTSRTHPISLEDLPRDARRYSSAVIPPDDPAEAGLLIAALHAAHFNWRATLALVEAFANGDPHDAAQLLTWLSRGLEHPDVMRHHHLAQLAELPFMVRTLPPWIMRQPGVDERGQSYRERQREQFWTRVDQVLDGMDAHDEEVEEDP